MDPSTKEKRKGRIEGIHKVTGKAKYSAEYELPNMAYGVFVTSTIAAGRILKLHVEDAHGASGVIDILSHENNLPIPALVNRKMDNNQYGLPVLHTDKVYYNGQPIALVLAESLEEAIYAASLVSVDYEEEDFTINFEDHYKNVPLRETGRERGTLSDWQDAPAVIDAEYTIDMEVHNPMEPHATIADWSEDGHLTLYDKSQNVNGVKNKMAYLMDMPGEKIRVVSEFVGGGFGSGLRVWYNTVAATMASKMLMRPVKVVLTRPQMFSMVGHRPRSWQRVRIGANSDGKLLGVLHQGRNATSVFRDHTDNITGISRKVYAFENVRTEMALVPLNIPRPTWMRGPGDSTGSFGVESAIDELCYLIDADPVDVRLKNIAPYQMETGNPWSSHYLDECINRGAEMIGWKDRPRTPGQLVEGEWKIGYGLALGLWNAYRTKAGAEIEMLPNGNITVRTAMTDIGTGTGQGMWNVAHEWTGIPREKIKIELGDSKFPYAPSQGGSKGMASISGAVVAASRSLKLKLARYAWGEERQINDDLVDRIVLNGEGISWKDDKNSFVSFEELFEREGLESVSVTEMAGPGDERKKYGFVSSAAHFYKVRVHETTGRVRVDRMVIVADAGTIINKMAAANQIIGAGVGGIGMALLEEQGFDPQTGRMLGNDFAGYHVPVNADAPIIEVSFINKPDPHINPSGAKGLGELGLIGSAAAVTNAIYNATGKRVRKLPVTPDKLV